MGGLQPKAPLLKLTEEPPPLAYSGKQSLVTALGAVLSGLKVDCQRPSSARSISACSSLELSGGTLEGRQHKLVLCFYPASLPYYPVESPAPM